MNASPFADFVNPQAPESATDLTPLLLHRSVIHVHGVEMPLLMRRFNDIYKAWVEDGTLTICPQYGDIVIINGVNQIDLVNRVGYYEGGDSMWEVRGKFIVTGEPKVTTIYENL